MTSNYFCIQIDPKIEKNIENKKIVYETIKIKMWIGCITFCVFMILMSIGIHYYFLGCSNSVPSNCAKYDIVDITITKAMCNPYGYYFVDNNKINCHVITTGDCYFNDDDSNTKYQINDTIKGYVAWREGTCKTKGLVEQDAMTGFSCIFASVVIFLVALLISYICVPSCAKLAELNELDKKSSGDYTKMEN